MAVFLHNFPTMFVASSARCEEKSSCFGHVKIHRSIPDSFFCSFFKGISWRHWWTIGNTVPGWAWLFVHYLTISKHATPDAPAEIPETFTLLLSIWFRPLFHTLSNHSSTKTSPADWSTTLRKPTKSPVEQWCQATDSSPLNIGLPNRPTLHV